MNRKTLPAIIAVLTLLIVGVVAWWGYSARSSPGPLHSSHEAVVALQGSAGCSQCHGNSKGAMTSSCVACHAPVSDQIAQRTGLHGGIDRKLADACERCHREHLGDKVALVSLAAFQAAGVQDPEHYNHSHAGKFTLVGKHAELTCVKCHKGAAAPLMSKGQTRYMGLKQQCTACHEDVHKGELSQDCASCHGQEKPFKDAPAFKHPETFPLTLGHAGKSCSACHKTPGVLTGLKTDCLSCHKAEYDKTTKPSHTGVGGKGLGTACADCHNTASWTKEVRYEHPATFPLVGGHASKACTVCHTSTSAPQNLSVECISCHRDVYDKTKAPNHAAASMDTKCEKCHGVEAWDKGVKFEHPATFSLAGGHLKTACAECHQAGEANQKLAAFKADPGCVKCHASPHSQTLATLASSMLRKDPKADTCSACHTLQDAKWVDANPRMTFSVHAATGFPLTTPHEIKECAKCHAPYDQAQTPAERQAAWRKAYPGRNGDDCQDCHKDPHNGQFSGSATKGRCLACHEAQKFVPSSFDMAKHETCGYPLTGSHRAVACAACHKLVDKVRQFVSTAKECVDCHKDVHNGGFDAPSMPKEVAGQKGCARCHNTESFSQVTWTSADHEQWAAFPLTGAHAKASCLDCHHAPAPAKPTKFAAAPKTCAGCHADIHAGQFRPEGAAETDCAKCHQDTTSFKTINFDHQKDSKFALDESHVKLACGACHKTYAAGEVSVVRYRPLGTTCADCHDDRKAPAGGGGQKP